MRLLPVAMLAIAALSAPAVSAVPQSFEEAAKTLSKPDYDNFVYCTTTAGASWGIMDKLNAGQSPEYLYEDVGRIKDDRVRDTLNKTVTLANQLKMHSSGMLSPDEFSSWNFDRCISTLLTGMKEAKEK